MSLTETVVEGTIRPDGTLVLDEPTKLRAGRVQVIVQALPELPDGDPFWDMMKSIWAGQRSRGHVPRSAEEVEKERKETRDRWEERQQAIERLQEESRRLREQHP
ncbi:MAG TPA: hypothetical protein VFI31_05970 [Pirellulales bacterium]|nr:hypothetical protein [Pirellulales bacterium]